MEGQIRTQRRSAAGIAHSIDVLAEGLGRERFGFSWLDRYPQVCYCPAIQADPARKDNATEICWASLIGCVGLPLRNPLRTGESLAPCAN